MNAVRQPLSEVPPPARTLRLLPPVRDDDATVVSDSAPADPPAWIREGIHHFVDEHRSYFVTLLAFARRPRASAVDWADGTFKAANPASYFLKSLAVVSTWHALWWWKFGLPQANLAESIGVAAGPYSYLGVIAVAHAFFRLSGSKRTMSSSVGVSMYALGGIPALASMLLEPLVTWMKGPLQHGHAVLHRGLTVDLRVVQLATTLASFGLLLVYSAYLGAVLAGLHGTSRRRATAYVGAGFVGFMALLVALLVVVVIAVVLVVKLTHAHIHVTG